jgi:hypothetical protein
MTFAVYKVIFDLRPDLVSDGEMPSQNFGLIFFRVLMEMDKHFNFVFAFVTTNLMNLISHWVRERNRERENTN